MTVFRGDTLEVGPATRPCNCPRFGPATHARGPLCRWDVERDDGLNLFRGLMFGIPVAILFWAIILYPWWRRLL